MGSGLKISNKDFNGFLSDLESLYKKPCPNAVLDIHTVKNDKVIEFIVKVPNKAIHIKALNIRYNEKSSMMHVYFDTKELDLGEITKGNDLGTLIRIVLLKMCYIFAFLKVFDIGCSPKEYKEVQEEIAYLYYKTNYSQYIKDKSEFVSLQKKYSDILR